MRVLKLVCGCLCSCLLVAAGLTPLASAAQTPGLGGNGLTGSPLVVLGAQELLGGQQLVDQRRSDLANPATVSQRVASRTRFEHLSARAAIKLAGETFPHIIEHPAGGLSSLPAGERIKNFVSRNAARISLPSGKQAVVETLQPIATPMGGDRFKPIDLALTPSGSGYVPSADDVGVHIPGQISSGVSIPRDRVTLTPVDPNGRPLSGAPGALEGASVLYANITTDTDALAKPTTGGVQLDALLRSELSPERLYYRVGMPTGGRLVADRALRGARVVLEGQTIAAVIAPSAQDAAGTAVPMRTAVSGDTLILTVAHRRGSYSYPIEVDPEAHDETVEAPAGGATNWKFYAEPAGKFSTHYTGFGIVIASVGNYVPPNYDELRYQAFGAASVTDLIAEISAASENAILKIEFANSSGKETEVVQATNSELPKVQVNDCVPNCFIGPYNNGNLVRYIQTAIKEGTEEYGFWAELESAGTEATVHQEAAPTASFNTSEAYLAEASGRQNVLYGSGGWLSEKNGALEVLASDPGLGVSMAKVRSVSGSWEHVETLIGRNLCSGVWCKSEYKNHYTYESKLPDGEDKIEVCAEDAAALKTCKTTTVKVDNTPPRAIALKGMAEVGEEMSAAPHQITVEATDGTSPTLSSGIKSVVVSIDGKSLGQAGGCTPGECTATSQWTIKGEQLGAGEHKLLVVATDYANNPYAREYTFAIREATPMSLPPGSVDPLTGQLALSNTDVSVAGVGSVSRSYTSRFSAAGPEDALGAQWALHVGPGMSLTALSDGNVELLTHEGRSTTFASDKKGGFIAPKGDESLKLEAKEGEPGKGITEYLLKNVNSGTTSVFTLPAGAQTWELNKTEGPAPSEAASYGYTVDFYPQEFSLGGTAGPMGIATGPDGNLWTAQTTSDSISRVTTGGAVTTYSLPSPFSCAYGITAAPKAEESVWFTDPCKDLVGRFTTTGVATAHQLPQGSYPLGITAGPDGKLWYTMQNSAKIGRMTTEGLQAEWALAAGSAPTAITAGPDGNLWFTERLANKIGRITTSGTISQFEVPVGSEPYGIAAGPDGNIWYVDSKTNKIGKMTTAGGIVAEYALPAGSSPREITSGPGGYLWFSDNGTGQIGRMSTSGVITEYKLSSGAAPIGVVQGPDKNLWFDNSSTKSVGVMHPIVKPAEVLGPVPSNVSCGKNPQEVKLEELKTGCRALTFTYTAPGKTTATSENSSGWGEYERHLASVSFTAYDPVAKEMKTKEVAHYLYGPTGRLRAEWDPRLSSPLKTTYGYDSEGHVSAVSPPGQQPWLIHYGTISSDSGAGRTLSVTRPAASTSIGNGNVPTNSLVPTISSTSPVIGTTDSVSSNGTWSNSPLAYSYQWEDCNGSGAQCKPIAGAVNKSYTPQARDAGYTLVVSVTGENATGTAVAKSAATKVIALSLPTYNTSFTASLAQPHGVAIAPSGNLWITDFSNNRVVEMTSGGTFIEAVGFGVTNGESKFQICTSSCRAGIVGTGNGQFSHPWGIAINQSSGNLYISDSSNSRVEELNSKGEFIRAFGSQGTGHGSFAQPAGMTIDSSGNLWVADYGLGLVEEFSETGVFANQIGGLGSGNGQMSAPTGVAISNGNLYVAEKLNYRVQEFTTAGSYVNQWGIKGSGTGEFEFLELSDIHTEPVSGDLYVTDCVKNQVRVFNPDGGFVARFGSTGKEAGQFTCPWGLSIDESGHIYAIDQADNRVEKWTPTYSTNNPVPAPPAAEGNSIDTIDYHVPLSGGSAPYQMTTAELAKWAQTKDFPQEATAVFPPDEPMGWPATDYKRASVTYLDALARIVNTARPNGGIATNEYNSLNELTRSLSAVNRATALKEGAKSAEVAEKLSSVKVYNPEGTQLIETYGPEHKIAVVGGEEGTRNRQKYSYDENEPAEEAGTHSLLTKSEYWSETTSKKVLEKVETHLQYSGQKNLGWKLRKPTLETTEIKNQTKATATSYNASTGEATETTTSVSTGSPLYTSQFGAAGSSNGQFKAPAGAAIDSHGNVWVADKSNNRVEELTSLGQFVAVYGSEGTGALQFKAPEGIAINQSNGNVYVSDTGNNRVEVLSAEGKFVVTYGFGVSNGETKYQTCTVSCRAGLAGSENGEFKNPVGVVVDASGNVWVVDRGNNRLEKFSSENAYLAKYGSVGTGELQFKEPLYVAISAGDLYVSDSGNARVEVLALSGTYVNQFGATGTGPGQFGKPAGITANPNTGRLYVVDPTNSRIEEFTEAGSYSSQFGVLGSGSGQLKEPTGVVADGGGDVYVVDSGNSRIESWEKLSPAPIFVSQFGNGDFALPTGASVDAKGNLWVANSFGNNVQEFSASGTRLGTYVEWGGEAGKTKEPLGVAVNRSSGNIYIGDSHNYRVDILNEKGEFTGAFGYGVSNGEEKLQVCTTTCREGLSGGHVGEFNRGGAVAVDAVGNIWVDDEGNQRIQEFNSKDEFVRTFGFGVSDGKAEFQVCTSNCQAGLYGGGAGQFANPNGLTVAGTHVYVSDAENNRIEMFTTEGAYVGQFSSHGGGSGQVNDPTAIATDAMGNVYVVDTGNNRVEEFTASGVFIRVIGNKGNGSSQMTEPEGIATDSSGYLYVVDSGDGRVEKWQLAPNPGNEGASNTKTTYYSAAANTEYPACGNHPEWANLVCQTEPVVQPGSSASPLPVTSTTYNIWDQAEVVTEKIGVVTRTTQRKFDAAGREISKEETTTSSEDAALPMVSDEYSTETGALIKQTETIAGKEKTLISSYNRVGQLVSYTDAAGAITKYEYDLDGRLTELSDPKGRQEYAYDPTSGYMTKLWDIAAGTFTASYDAGGNLLTVGYPNGMSARYVRNPIGQVTSLEYEKTTHCSEKCVWFSDSQTFGANGEVATQTSSLSKETYKYDETGRLTETQEMAGKECMIRQYNYNEENGQRESTSTRKATEVSECPAGEGGVIEGHFYDSVGRLIDSGVSYDALGNVKQLPAIDSGEQPISSSFYVDNQVAVQQQSEQTVEYTYDPSGRTLTAKLTGKAGSTTTMSHYAGDSEFPQWSCEEAGECKVEGESKWTRNIAGIDGSIDAIQTKGETPILQLHDLTGNIVATASTSETATGLLTTHNVTEFGVPVGTAPKVSWGGAAGASSELGTGVITSEGATYVPQLAQTVQTESVVPPGAAPNGVMITEVYNTPMLEWANRSGREAAEQTYAEQRALEAQAELEADGEGTDPQLYYTWQQAKNVGRKLVKVATYAEYLDVVLALPEGVLKFVEGALVEKLDGVAKAFDWFKTAGEELIQCSEESEICQFEYKDWTLKTPTVKLWDPFTFKTETIWEFKVTLVNPFSPAIIRWCIGWTVTEHKGCYALKKRPKRTYELE
jgi:YD repeat-containing protein